MLLGSIMGISAGCSSSKDEDPTSTVTIDKRIVGTWGRVAYYSAEDDFWTYAVDNSIYYTFRADGSYSTNASAKTSGTYSFTGSTLSLDGGFGESVKFSDDGKSIEIGKWRYQKK